jgi:hypothetical protein
MRVGRWLSTRGQVEDFDPSEGQSDWQLRLFLFLLRSTKRDAFLDHAKADIL